MLAIAFATLVVLGVVARLAMPTFVEWYVNRVLSSAPVYQGRIGGVEVHLWRGAYSIRDVSISKVTGNVPVPLFKSPRVDFSVQWDALLHGRVVARVTMDSPEVNFVDAPDPASTQTGTTGPWLGMLRDLSPFKIDSAVVREGSVHFRSYQTTPPVDAYLSHVEGKVENLSNVRNSLEPLQATATVSAIAMGDARLQVKVKIDPFSYKPTFQLGLRLLGLDATKLNDLAQAYGWFTFERGWFDLVVELNAKEGQLDGYVKPLFRNLKVLGVPSDLKTDNPIQFIWEALLEATTDVLKNDQRDQFGTVIPFTGSVDSPSPDVLAVIGNVLRNAFVRAYLPRLVGRAPDIDNLHFDPGKPNDAISPEGR